MKDGLLLFSHGSLLCGAGQALDEHAARLRDEFPLVEVGYLNYSEPTFETGVRRLVDAGAERIVIVPYFLVPGYFVTHSLPNKLDGIRGSFPNVEFIVAEALGTDVILADAMVQSAQSAALLKPGRRDNYASSALECRLREDCPIYGTSYCRRSLEKVSKVNDNDIPKVAEGIPTHI